PLLRAVAEQFEKPVVLAAPHLAELLEQDSEGLEILAPGTSRSAGQVIAEAKSLRQMRFNAVLLVNRSFRTALIAWLAGIPQRIGHATEGRGLFLTKRIVYGRTEHEGISYGNLALPLGVSRDFTHVHLTTTAKEREEGRNLLQGATIGIQPGASYFTKQLPLETLVRVVRTFQDEGRTVAAFGGREEAPHSLALQDRLSQPLVNLVGKTSIRQTLGAAANLDVLLAPSSGMMHMGVAVGCPTVAVFGPDPAAKWGHSFGPHRAIQIPSGRMEDLNVDEVLEAMRRALSFRSGGESLSLPNESG
ncbi:MAG TPA: glycosyltransferase family 9 protein, partial [Fimbriimonadaceae bacterium]|nr:glycosyltransferase family 9 protein [Fimbriimonadaceae bacterium]